MSDWTPEDVDALFQEGSERHEFEYNEPAWGQMEHLLDRRDKRRRLVWWFLFGIGLSLLVATFYWGLKNNNLGDKANVQNEILQKELSTKETNTEKKAFSEETITRVTKEESTLTTKEEHNLEEQAIVEQGLVATFSTEKVKKQLGQVVDSKELMIERSIVTQKSEIQANDDITNAISPDNKRQNPSSLISNQLGQIEIPLKENDPSRKLDIQKKEELKNRLITSSILAALPRLSALVEIPKPVINFDESFFEQGLKEEGNEQNDNHFVIGLLLASESSFVETSTICRPTWKAGLSLEYRFGGKHALKLGANYIKKDYVTNDASKYRAPQGFWENGVAPQSVMANCDVLELTLSESFFFKGHASRGFYANIGLTSYLMLEEIYNYSYDNPPSNARQRWGTQNTNQHWFGIGEVSFGYNFPFTDKSSLQIAPYAQIPLTGVGHGQLKLFSSGVLIRYNFHVR